MAIQQCDLVLVHIYPQGEDTLVSDRPKKEVGASEVTTTIMSQRSRERRIYLIKLYEKMTQIGFEAVSQHPPLLLSQISPLLTSEVHSVRAGRHLATKLNILVQQHFDLASTTITNIPMKVRRLQPVIWPCTSSQNLRYRSF